MLAHHPDDAVAVGPHRPREEGLVPAAVQHRPRVVAHPAVDGNVGADARKLLDRPDRVQRDRGACRDRPTGLRGDRRLYSVLLARVPDRVAPLGDGGCRLTFDVGDPQATPDRQLPHVVLLDEVGHDLEG